MLELLEERCLLSFGSPSLFDNGAGVNNNNAAVAIGDVYGYGIPDLVTATTLGSLSISQGKGDGTFQTPVIVSITPPAGTPLPTSFSAVKLVDLDGRVTTDGTPILDIVAADPAQDELWVLMNNGNGEFATAAYPTTVVPLPLGSDPVAMAVAGATPDFIDSSTIDFNGDTSTDLLGRTASNPSLQADIVIANPAGNNVIVLLGNGNGTFKAPEVYPVGDDPVAVALGDFNNDGYPDIITANKTGNSVSVLLNSGYGTFLSSDDIPITVPALPTGDTVDSAVSRPAGVAVGDFNGDGNLDFVTANAGWASVNVVLGNGNGTFGVQQTISTLTFNSDPTDPLNPDPPSAIVAGDFDGDGFVDIAFTEPNHDSIGVLDNIGDGKFAAPVDYPAGESPAALVTGNLNGEQTSLGLDRLDLVAIDPFENQFSVLLGQKFTSTTTLNPNVSNITWGGSVSVTPVVYSIDAPEDMPLTGSYQLVVDGNPYGVPQPVGSTFVLTELPAGSHTLGALFFGDLDYQGSTTTSTSTINVAAAELTVTASDYSRAYGAADPTSWPYTITGFVNGDVFEQSELKVQPTFSSSDTGSSSWVGNYTISQPDDSPYLIYNDANYVIDQTFQSGHVDDHASSVDHHGHQ